MATYPSLSYSITQRCKIHDGSVTQNGIISWSIEGQAEAAFNPSKANYLTDTSGWYSRYYWAANSGTYTFDTDAYTFSVTGTTTVYTKTIVKSSTGSLVSSYSTESEASAACAGVANSAFYIYEYKLESGKYNVYRYDLSVQTTSQGAILTKSISLSGYVDRTYTTPYVTGVSFGSTTQVRMPHYSGTGTGSASMLSYTISVYNPGGVSYTPSRTVNNSNSNVIEISHSESSRSGTIEISTKSIGTSTITVSSGGYSDSVDVTTYGVWTYGSDSDSVYCSFSNVQSGDTLSVTAGSKTNTVTASGTSQNVWVTGLSSSTSYSVSASVNGTTVWSGTITTDAATSSPSVSSVTISGDDSYSLTVGESKTVNYSISISNDNGSYTPSVSVASSNSTAVSYSDLTKSRTSGSFKINALAAGSATITVTAGSKTDTITVNSTAATPEVTVPSVDGWFITNNSIGVRIKDLNAGEVVTLNVGSQTKTITSTNGGSLDLVVDGLSAGTSYDVIVSTDLNGTLWSGQKSTEATMPDMPDVPVTELLPYIKGWYTTSSTIKASVRDLSANEELTLTVGSKIVKLTAESGGVGLDIVANGLNPGTTYSVTLSSNLYGTLFSGDKTTSAASDGKRRAYIGIPNDEDFKKQYTKLEYIESSGTQYINTGFNPNQDTRVVAKIKQSLPPSDATKAYYSFGVYSGSKYFAFMASISGYYSAVYGSSTGRANFPVELNTDEPFIVDFNKNKISINDYSMEVSTTTISTTYPLYLFGHNSAGSTSNLGPTRFYYCKIYDNGVLVRDFIPCKNNSTDEIGMFDSVEGKFYKNQGTGTFLYAEPIIYEPIQLEYILSDGNQYIDTGIIGKPGIETFIDIEFTSNGRSVPLGARNGSYYFYPISISFDKNNNTFGYYDSNIVMTSFSAALELNTPYKIYAQMYQGEQIVTINGKTEYTNTYSQSFTTSLPMYLLATNYSGNAENKCKAKLRGCKIVENGILVRDFVPCKLATGEVGMFDRVSHSFFENKGTGSFVSGNEVGVLDMGRSIEYTRVEYIRSTGTQFIDTGFKPNQNSKAIVDVEFTEFPTTHSAVFGSYDSTNTWWAYYRYSDSQYRASAGGTTQKSIAYSDPTVRTELTLQKNAFIVGEQEISITETNFSIDLNAYLFALNRNSSIYYPSSCKIYSCKIYDNDVLVRDFVPCKLQGNIVGMYDLVTGKFFANNGTGSFVAGSVIEENNVDNTGNKSENLKLPNSYKSIEYLESTGTQYIDTGVVGKSGLEILIDYEHTALTSDSQIPIGSMKASSDRIYPLSSGNYFGYGPYKSASISVTVNTRYSVYTKLCAGEQLLIVNGKAAYTGADSTEYDSSCNMYLFAANKEGTASYQCKAKIRCCKIYENGTLIRNFVPCMNLKGDAGMYDLVNSKFYVNAGTGEFVCGKVAEYEAPSVARRIVSAYIGVREDVPIYEMQTNSYNITVDNINDYFSRVNGSTYYFVGNGSVFTSNNKGKASQTATTTLTALRDMEVSFDYSYSCRSGDYFTLTVGASTIENKVYNTTTQRKSWSGTLAKGQTISFSYSKNASLNGGEDQCTFSNMVVSFEERVQTGSVSKDLARIIRKAYVGIGGVARPCMGSGLAFYGTVGYLSSSRYQMAATTVGNYALFGGGGNGQSEYFNTVDVFDKNLTKTTAEPLYTGVANLAATTVGNYALFAGGDRYSEGYDYSAVNAYDRSLTYLKLSTGLSQARNCLSATTVGGYAIFAGGRQSTIAKDYDDVDVFDASLTRILPDVLSLERHSPLATTVGDYALFIGGMYYGGSASRTAQNIVDAYDKSLTHSIAEPLGTSIGSGAATTVGKYALIVEREYAYAYDAQLTCSTPDPLATPRYKLNGTTVGGYAVFGGGFSSSSSFLCRNSEAYDTALTHITDLVRDSDSSEYAATTVGRFAIFAGGYHQTYAVSTVDAFTVC